MFARAAASCLCPVEPAVKGDPTQYRQHIRIAIPMSWAARFHPDLVNLLYIEQALDELDGARPLWRANIFMPLF